MPTEQKSLELPILSSKHLLSWTMAPRISTCPAQLTPSSPASEDESLTIEETKVQRGEVTCLRSHCQQEAEARLEPRAHSPHDTGSSVPARALRVPPGHPISWLCLPCYRGSLVLWMQTPLPPGMPPVPLGHHGAWVLPPPAPSTTCWSQPPGQGTADVGVQAAWRDFLSLQLEHFL